MLTCNGAHGFPERARRRNGEGAERSDRVITLGVRAAPLSALRGFPGAIYQFQPSPLFQTHNSTQPACMGKKEINFPSRERAGPYSRGNVNDSLRSDAYPANPAALTTQILFPLQRCQLRVRIQIRRISLCALNPIGRNYFFPAVRAPYNFPRERDKVRCSCYQTARRGGANRRAERNANARGCLY